MNPVEFISRRTETTQGGPSEATPSPRQLETIQEARHPCCCVCGRVNPDGLHLDFAVCSDGSVEARFQGSARFQGYPGLLHGGIVALLLDGAMTNCLFAHGHAGLTAELVIRFPHPALIDRQVTVRGWITRARPPLFEAAAALVQDGQIKAKATGKFLERPARTKAAAAAGRLSGKAVARKTIKQGATHTPRHRTPEEPTPR